MSKLNAQLKNTATSVQNTISPLQLANKNEQQSAKCKIVAKENKKNNFKTRDFFLRLFEHFNQIRRYINQQTSHHSITINTPVSFSQRSLIIISNWKTSCRHIIIVIWFRHLIARLCYCRCWLCCHRGWLSLRRNNK
jgi:hypothetical protein